VDNAHSIVVVGASAGGVSALKTLVGSAQSNWPVAMFITLHIGRNRTQLSEVLNRISKLPVQLARHGEWFRRGIYIAPPDRHLLISNGKTLLSEGPKENYCRPAIDPMFRSAAQSYGSKVTGVLLTGHLHDGMNGLFEIDRVGGCTIVQDPNDAEIPEIPLNAISRVQPNYILPLCEIPEAIARCIDMEGTRKRREASHE
jgi:two-component system, chemotaxis family, protein-glutamate methylesterase/glutaminase